MKTFKQFLIEGPQRTAVSHIANRLAIFKAIRNKVKPIRESNEIPFEHSPKIGWWKDKKTITVYHGTHERNVPDITKNGINRKDPKTGMVSLALDPHTAHGYAAMSSAGGERHFRDAGGKAVTTPHEQRSVVKMEIPMRWVNKHLDPNLRGNIGVASGRLTNKSEYEKHKGADHEYYQMSELRVSKEVPARFIKGVMKRGK